MQIQRPIAGIGEVIGQEGSALIAEGKKTIQESVQDLRDTVFWVLAFGLIDIGRETADRLAIQDQKETQEQIRRYRAMIAEEQEIGSESHQKLIDWRKITDAEMKKGQPSGETAPPAADLSDLGSTRSNPSLFTRTNKEQLKKGGM